MNTGNNFIEQLRQSLNDQIQATEFNPKIAYRTSMMDLDAEIEHPPIVLSKGEYAMGQNRYPTVLASEKAFSAIVGAPKSRKSFFKSALIAAYLGGNANSYFEDLKGHHNGNKMCLSFDTEQSEYHAQRVNKRIIDMVGAKHPNFRSFALQQYPAKQRFQIIEHALLNENLDLGLVVIDGVADLVNNVNDLDEANRFIDRMMYWVNQTSCHIITVIHRNTSQMNSRATGHLGSALMKKCETVYRLNVEDDKTVVESEHSRNYPFDTFAFKIWDGKPQETQELEDIF